MDYFIYHDHCFLKFPNHMDTDNIGLCQEVFNFTFFHISVTKCNILKKQVRAFVLTDLVSQCQCSLNKG